MRYKVDVGAMKARIQASGLKQRQVAKQVGMTECTMSRAMQGRVRMKADEYLSICRVLGVPPESFAVEEKQG